MRPLFTKHVSHPVRSRFSAFAFTGSSLTKGGRRIDDDEETAADSSNARTLTSQTMTSKSQNGKSLTGITLSKTISISSSKAPVPTTESFNGPDEITSIWHMDEWERDIIRPLPPGAHSHYSVGTPEYPAKHCRRKEHWEIVEEREREEEAERARKEKMDPSKWEQRKQQWERLERMNSKGRLDDKKPLPPAETSPPTTSWYNGWGNRMGHGDGNQGWELELGPLAGGVELPPTAESGSPHDEPGFHTDAEPFGKF